VSRRRCRVERLHPRSTRFDWRGPELTGWLNERCRDEARRPQPESCSNRQSGRNVGGDKCELFSSSCAIGLAIALTLGGVSTVKAQQTDSTPQTTKTRKSTKTKKKTSSSQRIPITKESSGEVAPTPTVNQDSIAAAERARQDSIAAAAERARQEEIARRTDAP